ncbi:MAG TPA: hypothetical protein VED86_04295 [archaeon]|nr:hypothetical protein [archaeon]
MSGTVSDRQRLNLMMSEGTRLIEEAKKRDIHLRLLGAIAFQFHCPKFSYLSAKLDRILTDVDFAGYSKERDATMKMMREFGYADEPAVTTLFGHRRLVLDNKSNGVHIDIFLDKLEMNHDIPFKDRLDLDELTISLADMLLEKMQIVQLNEKDFIDTMMLIREHEIGENGNKPETIDAGYIAKLLASEWGFYYTVTTNLGKVQARLAQYGELSAEDREDITGKIGKLLKRIEEEPKSFSWKMRARVGPKSKWYRDVEEVTR